MDRRTLVPLGVLIAAVVGVLVWRGARGSEVVASAAAPAASTDLGHAPTAEPDRTSAVSDPAPEPSPAPPPASSDDPDEAGHRSDPTPAAPAGAGLDPHAAAAAPAAEPAGAADHAASTPDEGPTRGSLSPQAIRDVVRENAGYFRFCFEWELHRHPDLAGRVTMEFVIAEDGSVREAHVMEDGLENETVTRCFAGVTSRMTFPPPEHGEVTVHYPFLLDGAPPAQRPEGI